METNYGISEVEALMAHDGYTVLTPGMRVEIGKEAGHVVVLDGKLFYRDGRTPGKFPVKPQYSFDVVKTPNGLHAVQTSNSPYEVKILEQRDPTKDKWILLMTEDRGEMKSIVRFVGQDDFLLLESTKLK